MSKTDSSLKTYIDLTGLIQIKKRSHEENRHFGLSHKSLLGKPILLLESWTEAHRHLLPKPLMSERLTRLLSSATLILLVIAFFLGILSGIGLLRYSGDEPVNLLYFLAAVLFLPLATMTMTLWAMMRANQADSLLVHLSPAYWMERIILLLPVKNREMVQNLQINPLIGNWIVIRRSQEFALAFSLGLFVALIGVVASEDIAFGWSTTLQIAPGEFHHFLSLIALPWREFLPQALPSLELIEKSHYFRLGGKLSSEMISSATLLGEWWKFLAMTTLFYALVLRFLLFLFASSGLRRAIGRATLSIEGVRDMLRQMQEPLVNSRAPVVEPLFEKRDDLDIAVSQSLEDHYSAVIGWALDREALLLQNEREGIAADALYEAGGLHSLEEDQQVIGKVDGDILFYVKSWEPPTMDFIDFLTDLSRKESAKILLYPLGTSEQEYKAAKDDFEIWAGKIDSLNRGNIRMKQ